MLDQKELERVSSECLAHYGERNQISKIIEEMAELTVVLSHYSIGRNNIREIAEEFADVKFMLNQLELLMNEHTRNKFSALVDTELQYKIRRVETDILFDKMAAEKKAMDTIIEEYKYGDDGYHYRELDEK